MSILPIQEPQAIPVERPPGPVCCPAVEPLGLNRGETGAYDGPPVFLLIETVDIVPFIAELRPQGETPVRISMGRYERNVIGPFHKYRPVLDGRGTIVAALNSGPLSFTLVILSGACKVTAYPGRW